MLNRPRSVFRVHAALLATCLFGLCSPIHAETVARCGKGWLETIDGQMVLHLEGSPREMGFQHGALLKKHVHENINYLVREKGGQLLELGPLKISPRGAIDMIVNIQRKHVPAKYVEEIEGLSAGAGIPVEDLMAGNFIPEMFHCSGFAVMDSATTDGTMYHGRVLDYACDWRLQEHSVIIVAKPDNGIPFVNISYAGFVGSVTGMNAKNISIGEMGGAGLGHWNGVPMALLMRQVLEGASTLDEAVAVFKDNPRTCEYYYVIADGKTNKAVGMEATWKSVTTVNPGEKHARLPLPVNDAVLLSAGTRYEDLVKRVKETHGKIDADAALKLMDRPVAMKSNLHNVLFESKSTRFWLANASVDGQPAATQPYSSFRLTELLRRKPDDASDQIPMPSVVVAPGSGMSPDGTVLHQPGADESTVPQRFRLGREEFPYWQKLKGNFLGGVIVSDVQFPSPVETPHEVNNTVHCEYFAPVGSGEHPGVVVLHILGGDFELSRMICRSLAVSGTGALFVKMPYYGPRRVDNPRRRMISSNQAHTVEGMTQAVVDIRRAATWLSSRPEIDEKRLGITGISLGGIVGSLAAAVEPRFRKACLVLAGGDLGRIVIESEELKKEREAWDGPAMTVDEVRAIMKPVDPLTYAGRLRSKDVLMMNAKNDRVIPRACTDDLWKGAGKPKIIWWDADHYSAAKHLPTALFRMAKFFRESSYGLGGMAKSKVQQEAVTH